MNTNFFQNKFFDFIFMAVLARQLGLVWGGAWRTPYDPGHVQLGELSTATLHHAYTTGSATLAQLL